MGSGCAPDAGQPSNNPLSALFSGLLDSTRKDERLAQTHMQELHITGQDRDKIASRTGIVTRHLFPGGQRFHAASCIMRSRAAAAGVMEAVHYSQMRCG